MFENRVLRRIFGPKRDEILRVEWRKLNSKELNDLYSSPHMKLVNNKFKSGGLHEKHVVATWNLGNHFSLCV